MDEAKLESLRQLDWEEIAARLANFARRTGRNLYGWDGRELMPRSLSPEDIACEVIGEFWDDPDRFNANCALTTQLCGVVKQKLWNLSQSKEAKTTTRERELEKLAGRDHARLPDVSVQSKDMFERALDILADHPRVRGKPDHESVLAAFAYHKFDPDELEQETGIPRARIYQVQRELHEIYPEIKRKLQEDGGGSP